MNRLHLARRLPGHIAHFRTYLKHQGEARLRAWLRRVSNRPAVARLARRLVVERRYPINLGHPDRVAVLLVGCGGTGSVRRATA
jgi:hypothetical protein